MQIFVRGPDGRHVAITVEPTDNIAAVKQKIQVQLGTPANRQLLTFGTTPLERGTLLDYSVQKDCTITMVMGPPFQVFIRSTDGKTYAIEIDPDAPVANLKREVHAKTNIEPASQVLTFQGRALLNGNLSEYGIQKDCTIQLALAVAGGS
jgi:hypothetical protein